VTTPGSQGPVAPDEGPTGASVPTCYRHPGRETYVRCARCDRPICPDCMRNASVGFQCPECVAEGSRSMRPARTIFGGRVSQNPGTITLTLIGICVVTYLLQITVVGFQQNFFDLGIAVADGEYYRLLTAAFLHGSLLHLMFNMLALYMLGPGLEAALGRVRFLALYLLSALGGSVTSYALASPLQPSLGASGAIFGLFGATLVISRRLRADVGPILVVLGINLVLSFTIPNIDWRAHIGGLVVGAIIAAGFAYAPRTRRDFFAYGVCGLLFVLEVAVALWRTSDIGLL
jgi:membrane associated rhomboid family serine protease